jgi:hypothetical protein
MITNRQVREDFRVVTEMVRVSTITGACGIFLSVLYAIWKGRAANSCRSCRYNRCCAMATVIPCTQSSSKTASQGVFG